MWQGSCANLCGRWSKSEWMVGQCQLRRPLPASSRHSSLTSSPPPRLSQMILDKVLAGILDQGAGCLIVYDDAPPDATYAATLETLRHVGNVVDSLAAKAKALS